MALVLDYTPHPAQLAIHAARHRRFRIVCSGRRFGKTLLAAAELIDRRGGEAAGDYGWIAPTYFIAERGVEACRAIAGDLIRFRGVNPVRAEFTGQHGPVRVLFLSADNPDSILGLGFRGLLVDEAARIPPDVWHYTIRPTISQTEGWALLISTPAGRNWFYDLFTRGRVPAETQDASFAFPSRANPFFPASQGGEARRALPPDVFRIMEITPEGSGSKVTYAFEAQPATLLGRLAGASLMRKAGGIIERLAKEAVSFLKGQSETMFDFAPPPLPQVARARVDAAVALLEAGPYSHGLARRLGDLVLKGQEMDVGRLRPIAGAALESA